MSTKQQELGDFLRSRRELLTPEEAGLRNGRARRTPGLRREEVAELAGIGVDWYIRLEQGRAVTPSQSTIDGLVRALKLGKAEHAHLRALARTPERRVFSREVVPEPVQKLVLALREPAYVTGRRWDVLAWNAAATELFVDFGKIPRAERNILVFMLTHPDARRLFGETWADEAARMVAQFRASHDLWAEDPAFVELMTRLRRGSAELSGWWKKHLVRGSIAGQKTLYHPRKGAIRVSYATFQSNDDPALKLSLYTRGK